MFNIKNNIVKEINNQINNSLFDWIMCILLGIAAIIGLILLFLVDNKQLVLGCTLGLALMSLTYSPLVHKNALIRILLAIATLLIVVY